MIRKVRWLGCAATSFALMVGAASCGGAHDAMRPDQPTAAGATGRVSVKPVEGPSSPLIVDWKAEQRGDLEEVVHDGVAVVAWDDQGLRLLRGCKVGGEYGYLALQTKKEAVHLETADEVQATLPLGGLGIAGKIGGGFDQGTSLDIATEIVGKRRATTQDAGTADLKGNCQGATHYIRALDVGAFVMKTGSKANAQAAVQILGVGSSGSSASAKDVASSDGSPDACEKATGEESKPVPGCAALLRIELVPISKSQVSSTPGGTGPANILQPHVTEGCPAGFVPVNGGCKRQSSNAPHVCSPNSPDDCAAQCSLGNAESCDLLGSLIASGARGARDMRAAQQAFTKACDLGFGNGCAKAGWILLDGGPGTAGRAANVLATGCRLGSGLACGLAGEAYMKNTFGRPDLPLALKLSVRGCEGGDTAACANAGYLYSGTAGLPADVGRLITFSRRACYGGSGAACNNVAVAIEQGRAGPPNPSAAAEFHARACRLDRAECRRTR